MIHTYLLDTNTLSNIVRRKSFTARSALRSLGPADVAAISCITEAEIRFGLAKTPHAHALRTAILDIFSRLIILPWGSHEAAAYATLRATLESAGTPLGNLDMLIAAHAVAIGATLVTTDKAFRHVRGIAGVVDWATDL